MGDVWVLLKYAVVALALGLMGRLALLGTLVGCLAGSGGLVVDHVDQDCFCKLTGVLSRHLLSVLKVLEQTLLLSVKIDVLTKERIDLLPVVMLTEGVHGSHFRALRNNAG